MTTSRRWLPTIGLEVHIQLATRSKLFCGCPNSFGAAPNSQVCQVCIGLPGTLPVSNRRAIELAARLGLALGCEIDPASQWVRKHYFYPDLPKAYQITQDDRPVCRGGAVDALVSGGWKSFSLRRIHLEEDAGKLLHAPGGNHTLVDLNRAGVPLVEVVSEPCLRSPEEAAAFLRALRQIVRTLGVSGGDMEKGELRCDANVSVRLEGSRRLGCRVEIKNLNSFRFAAAALGHEVERHVRVLAAGGRVAQETRGYDEATDTTFVMRSKEEAPEYRYFPEPDLGPALIPTHRIESLRAEQPELPRERYNRYTESLGIGPELARILLDDPALSAWFDEAIMQRPEIAPDVIRFVLGELSAWLGQHRIEVAQVRVPPVEVGRLVALSSDGRISLRSRMAVWKEMVASGDPAWTVVQRLNLLLIDSEEILGPVIDDLLATNPLQVAAWRSGQRQIEHWLMGQVMRATRGRAAADVVKRLLLARLRA